MEISLSVPLDSDGFIRRECPACEREFKWMHKDDDSPPIQDQYFCPICGVPADPDSWWTRPQLEAIETAAMPTAIREIQASLSNAFRSSRNVRFKPSNDVGDPVDTLLHEPDDMMIVIPPCHPEEPLKVPDEMGQLMFCLVCGEAFGV